MQMRMTTLEMRSMFANSLETRFLRDHTGQMRLTVGSVSLTGEANGSVGERSKFQTNLPNHTVKSFTLHSTILTGRTQEK